MNAKKNAANGSVSPMGTLPAARNGIDTTRPPVVKFARFDSRPISQLTGVILMSAVTAARFERIGKVLEVVRTLGPNIGKLLELFQGIDLSKLGVLFGLISNFAGITSDPKSEAGIIERVTAGIEILKTWAAMTASTADDSIAAFIDKIAGNPDTLKWIAGLVATLLARSNAGASPSVLSDTLEAETATIPVHAAAFDLGSIIALVKLLFELIAAFTKKPA